MWEVTWLRVINGLYVQSSVLLPSLLAEITPKRLKESA